jgi:hypothetical protein
MIERLSIHAHLQFDRQFAVHCDAFAFSFVTRLDVNALFPVFWQECH